VAGLHRKRIRVECLRDEGAVGDEDESRRAAIGTHVAVVLLDPVLLEAQTGSPRRPRRAPDVQPIWSANLFRFCELTSVED